MKWKQFLTPIKSINTDKAREFMKDKTSNDLMFLDVRQPKEYEEGHIAGARLIPLPELNSRLHEIDPQKSTVVYCAIGGRSRIAAQLLAGRGFENVINLSGGFKAWNGETAVGDELQGLELFSGDESPEQTLAIAYSLEDGLRDFYISMASIVQNKSAIDLFKKLADIEVKHQDKIYSEYKNITEGSLSREDFINSNVADTIEGGLTTEEYVSRFNPDWESVKDITGIAMSIEAQALDLYLRMSQKNSHSKSKKALEQLADDERDHLKALGKLIENL
ncbi:MAG: rhodanese-like domain-containing protein [Thermodesulfobacteriota bacterium]|nr:rhodanese-like domain-containing protein [Thermodesulfobacteriota bacterium]